MHRDRQATGVHDDTRARGCVVQNAAKKIAVVTLAGDARPDLQREARAALR